MDNGFRKWCPRLTQTFLKIFFGQRRVIMKLCFFVFCVLISFSSYSQLKKDEAKKCDLNCSEKIIGATALPAVAALGSHKFIETFKLGETEIYWGLSGQPMMENEISRTINIINEKKAFEKPNVIVVNSSNLDVRHYTIDDFKSKLIAYSINKNGVERIAIKNRNFARGVPGILGVGTAFILY